MPLKCVVNNDRKKKPLTDEELIAKIQKTGKTYIDRENVVIQNLKELGL